MNEKYTEKQWGEEMSQEMICGLHPNIQAGSCNLPCPSCRTRSTGLASSVDFGKKHTGMFLMKEAVSLIVV